MKSKHATVAKYFAVFFLSMGILAVHAQTTLNNYKYVLVPEGFGFLKQKDQYRLNTLTKSTLEKNGFSAYYDNAQLPAELANNRCNELFADVLERNSMFSTRLTVVLKDCKGNIIFKSREGTSREKSFDVAYSAALEDAFTSLAETHYVYQPVAAMRMDPVVSNPAPDTAAVAKPLAAATLYAQPIANGYQLVDTSPKTILKIFKTSVADYFIAANESANGILFRKGENWVFEYYKDGKFQSEALLIKF